MTSLFSLFGITTLQTFIYFKESAQDRWPFRLLVRKTLAFYLKMFMLKFFKRLAFYGPSFFLMYLFFFYSGIDDTNFQDARRYPTCIHDSRGLLLFNPRLWESQCSSRYPLVTKPYSISSVSYWNHKQDHRGEHSYHVSTSWLIAWRRRSKSSSQWVMFLDILLDETLTIRVFSACPI